MKLQKTYTFLLVKDLAAAESWYTKFFGRGPDNRPMDVLVQWEFDHGSVGISTNDKIARTGAAFIIVDDLEAECRRLEGVGINADAPRKGDYSTLAAVHDPDSNLFTLASPLSRPYPPA